MWLVSGPMNAANPGHPVTVAACIQQVPPDATGKHDLERKDIEASADTYLDAVAKVEGQVPDGWRVLYVRTT